MSPPVPELPVEKLIDLLDADIILDEVRDAPHQHVAEAVARAVAGVQTGVDPDQLHGVQILPATD